MEHENKVLEFAHLLATSKTAQRKAILETSSKAQRDMIGEFIFNLLFNSEIQLQAEDRNYLNRHIVDLRKLASKHLSVEEKRAILVSKQAVIKYVANVIASYFNT